MGSDIGWPMLIGSTINGLVVAVILYIITFFFVSAYRNAREIKLAERRQQLNGKLTEQDNFETTQ